MMWHAEGAKLLKRSFKDRNEDYLKAYVCNGKCSLMPFLFTGTIIERLVPCIVE